MDGLKNYREKIKSIEKLVDKMESGELSINELVELESLTRDLHERSIILKYKAFENRTGDSAIDTQEPELKAEEIEEIVEEVEEAIEETPVMDFSMFDSPAEKPKRLEVEEERIVETERSEPVRVEKPEPVIDENPQQSTQVSAEPKAEVPNSDSQAKLTISEELEANNEEEPVAEEPKVVVNSKGTSFLDRLNIVDNSISSQLAGRKIDSLSGAFGINERLLYINELFDGSGEEFSDAIKTLDSQPGLDEASTKVEEMAFKNSWDPEEDTVLEFLAIIKRRYA